MATERIEVNHNISGIEYDYSWHSMPNWVRQRNIESHRTSVYTIPFPTHPINKNNNNNNNNNINEEKETENQSTDSKTNKELFSLFSTSSLGFATHTVRFHGSNWQFILETQPSRLEEAFRIDVFKTTGIESKRIENLIFDYTGILVVRFIINHNKDETEMSRVHKALQAYTYPFTVGVYHQTKREMLKDW